MSFVGMSTEILDGKLSPKPSLPEDVTLIIDRAYDGPSNELYFVSDTEKAKVIFGKNSPIIQSMRHAYAGGSTNVALYRIGGSGAVVTNLFGPYTALKTTSQRIGAGSTLKVYAGPRATDPTRSVVIVKDGDKVVYSNAPGQAVDLGLVSVEGFKTLNFPFQVGTVDNPVPFSDIINNIKSKGSETITATDLQTAFVLSAPVSDIVQITKTSGVVTTIVPTSDYTVNITGGNATGFTLTTGAVEDDVYEVTTLTLNTPSQLENLEIAYESGKDSMNITLNKLYELYDQAFVDLETVDVFGIVVADLFDCRNIAAGDDATSDRLTYVTRTETDYGFTYEWSSNKFLYQLATDPLLTTTDPDLAALDDLGQPIVTKQYHEVDFAHRLGMWAWLQSSNGTYVNANIGPRGPEANYTVAINRWIGKVPTKNIYGQIIENGYGLLGNRFISGTTSRSPGFYATDTGYPDGNPLYDSSEVIIDIGKYLSIPVMPVFITSEAYTSEPVFVKSCSSAYAGLVTRVTVGDSTTNLILPNVTAQFRLKPGRIQALSDAGYVVLEEKAKGLTIYSGDLATQSESDYDYISTAIAVTFILNRLRVITDPYIGKGLSSTLMAALYNAIDVELKSAVTRGFINGFNFNLLSDGPHSLILPLSLQAKEELRTISVVLSLAENQLFSV